MLKRGAGVQARLAVGWYLETPNPLKQGIYYSVPPSEGTVRT